MNHNGTPNLQRPTPNCAARRSHRTRHNVGCTAIRFGSWELVIGSWLTAFLLFEFAPAAAGQQAGAPDASAWTTAQDLNTADDYGKERMPAVNVGLLDGQLAWRQHDGGHTDGPNWKYFIPWATRLLGR